MSTAVIVLFCLVVLVYIVVIGFIIRNHSRQMAEMDERFFETMKKLRQTLRNIHNRI